MARVLAVAAVAVAAVASPVEGTLVESKEPVADVVLPFRSLLENCHSAFAWLDTVSTLA